MFGRKKSPTTNQAPAPTTVQDIDAFLLSLGDLPVTGSFGVITRENYDSVLERARQTMPNSSDVWTMVMARASLLLVDTVKSKGLTTEFVFGLVGLDANGMSPTAERDVVNHLAFSLLTNRDTEFDWSPEALQSLSIITGTETTRRDQMVGYSILATRVGRHLGTV